MKPLPPTPGVVAGQDFKRDGFALVPAFLPPAECASLAGELTVLLDQQSSLVHQKKGGVRHLLRQSSAVAALAVADPIKLWLNRLTGADMFPVRALFFDKTPTANWRVPWHQDVTIAVQERRETPGFAGWSIKEEVLHVQPPAEILETMVAVRFHLDDCDSTNGALKVIPSSHLWGRIASAEIAAKVADQSVLVCALPRGGAMAMRPLLLHTSAPAANPNHRRVLHIEYAAGELPNGLQWFDAL